MENLQDLRDEYNKTLVEGVNRILHSVSIAEKEVQRNERYWRACETLFRLTLSIRRTQDWLKERSDEIRKRAAEIQKAEQNTKLAKEPEVDDIHLERLDKREEIENPDPFDKGNWSFN